MAKTRKKIILIVEDDEILLRALYLLFHNSGYTIASATDGDSALKMAQRLKPDLVLLDLLLPKMNGFDVLRDMKADPNLKNIPVVVLSNLGDVSDIEKAKGLGAFDYYVKANTELSSLEEKIKSVLG
ncbi:MAG: Response regulator receiver protein [Candidatus Magasanikbacteria bacterium GW2011_GWC2_40_17]|uniref:Response regulator receiver protein n=1 Tax=Candidatus Magasanikbacteria bacterium GW2011_GWA2_42_32 TaxID=1619039 RepID=A0A0G1A7B7_9BACT|nr:MAG: Response regulator receiver protein [Candidatus Magasanikbacteria bacterium GW2011_GWC2_40_17]KKS56942.1 MAG: Response regulator receiver protein [Candidatus Magasanikbacteria bacterium GW2011_GWA2_42_32]OGH85490.1 MAG: hypothetical protein A2294_03085 [Candidatus Magasanikbacteria bacterium RIFOXYB2_FULL_38_10]OGZ86241.1 MAG: hypothetical protein A2463_01435 [Candidatus Staskawiczbacteria bacterium RIFOXYC2_FULL_32_10]